MAESILFRGSTLKFFDVRQGKEGGEVFCRIHMSSDFSEQVKEAMEWDVGDSPTDAKLPGELLASDFILTPGDSKLRDFELNFAITSVEDFRVVSLKDDDGDPCGRELRFVVRSPTDGVGALCENYIRRVGRHQGALKISYSKTPKEQQPLDLQGNLGLQQDEQKVNEARAAHGPASDEELLAEFGPEDEGICVSCANRVPHEDEERTRHVTGQPCARHAGSTLASAAAAGGTHQRKRGRRSVEVPPEESDQDDSTVQ